MMAIDTSFFIRVNEHGGRTPSINVFPPQYEMLSHLAEGQLSNSAGVINEINAIKKVMNGHNSIYSFAPDDWCIIDVKNEISVISNGFDEFEPLEIKTKNLLDILEKWAKFLKKYEDKQIPGLVY